MIKEVTVNIILIGRTGAGKSSLGNKIAGRTIFREGHSLISETETVAVETITWPNDITIKVKLIDCPGHADNRQNNTNEEILSKILTFLQTMKNGVNIVLFCTNAKSRFDANDSEELEILYLLLGEQLNEHIYIVVTQLNNYPDTERPRIQTNYKTQLPKILREQALPSIPEERILFADFTRFDEFMIPLTKEVQTKQAFVPKIAKEVNPEDPESIARFLQSPEMKKMIENFEKTIESQKNQIVKIEKRLVTQKEQLETEIKDYKMKQEQSRNLLNNVNSLLMKQQYESQNVKKELETKQILHQQQIKEFNEKIGNISNNYNLTQQMIEQRDKQITKLNKRINEMKKIKAKPKVVIQKEYIRESGGDCNLM